MTQVIKAELQEAVKLNEANKKKEKDLYKKMVQGLQNDDPKSEEKHYFNQSSSSRWVCCLVCDMKKNVFNIIIW